MGETIGIVAGVVLLLFLGAAIGSGCQFTSQLKERCHVQGEELVIQYGNKAICRRSDGLMVER